MIIVIHRLEQERDDEDTLKRRRANMIERRNYEKFKVRSFKTQI